MAEKFDLVSFRSERGLTQRDLAKALNVNWKYVSMIETGAKPLSKKLKYKLDQLQLDGVATREGSGGQLDHSCERCTAKDREIEWLREQLSKAQDNLAAALATKPSAGAGPACSAADGVHKERRGA
jgi:DNA-binding XRE family transcriptional regulator